MPELVSAVTGVCYAGGQGSGQSYIASLFSFTLLVSNNEYSKLLSEYNIPYNIPIPS